MSKTLVTIFLLLVAVSVASGVLLQQRGATGDPCDGYGDCLSASIAYLRANPDNSLYFGDSFQVTLAISYGPNTVSSQTTWSYDAGAFAANTSNSQADFRTLVNASSSYTISASVTFTVVICTTSNGVTTCTTYYSTLTVQETVQARGFVLQLNTRMANFTNPQGYLLRNPDGSFYHEDEFFINYTYSFLFMQQRPDIKVYVDVQYDPTFVKLTKYDNATSTGYFLFTGANRTGTSEITMSGRAFNYLGGLLGIRIQKQPFAVVNYAPYFKEFTYMDYNYLNSSAYERPFTTLIRYDGNNPGYAYGGDVNTAPITAVNDTGERALINSFNFTTIAWGIRANLSSGDISQDLSFWNQTSMSIGTKTTNQTFPIITFAHRVVKFYFQSSVPEIGGYTGGGLEYFNVTELAISRHFAGGNHGLFNTTYLYEPVYYNGYITVFTYGPAGLDPSTVVNVTLVTPDPLNPHLLASLNKTFSSDPEMVRAFETDLFPSSSYVASLEPSGSSGGRWVFLLNDTNLAMANDTQMPNLYITITSTSGTYSYSVSDAFSTFVVDQSLLPSLPFPAVQGYYLDQQMQLTALPLNYSFTSPTNSFIAWDYGSGGAPSFVSPITYEPGNLSKIYGFLYGGNSTIYANLDGGGASLVGVQVSQSIFQGMAMVGPQSGGAEYLWVKDPNGNVIMNESLTADTQPPSPPGYFGFYAISLPMSVNGTYQFGLTNSWGVSSVFQTYANVVQPPPPPSTEYFLMTFFGFLLVGLYFLGKIARRTHRGTHPIGS